MVNLKDKELTKAAFKAELRAAESRFREVINDLRKKLRKRFYFWREDDDEIFEDAKKEIDLFIEEKIKEL